MANVLLAGRVLTGAGVAVVGATVEVFDRDTTTTVRAAFTGGTDASGDWSFSYAPGANSRRVDVRITNGTSISFLKYNDQIQVSSVETANLRLINPAFTFEYDIVPAAITAARQLNLPLLTGTDTFAVLALAQTFLTGVKTFNSSILAIRNPADTFSYTIVASAITAARNLILPLITADDTIAVLGLAQTFSQAITLSAATGNTLVVDTDTMVVNATNNSVLLGATSLDTDVTDNSGQPRLGILNGVFSHIRGIATAGEVFWDTFKTRSTGSDANVAVLLDDRVWTHRFYVADGLNYQMAGQIQVAADGNTSSTSSPGRITFSTTVAGATAVTERMRITAAGAIRIGSATGTENAGDVNVSGDVRKNGTAYTNPAYVLEHWAKGTITKFIANIGAREYTGLQPLHEVADFVHRNFELPQMALRSAEGIFGRGDQLLASVEEAYLYLFDHEDRIVHLEQDNKVLRQQLADQKRD